MNDSGRVDDDDCEYDSAYEDDEMFDYERFDAKLKDLHSRINELLLIEGLDVEGDGDEDTHTHTTSSYTFPGVQFLNKNMDELNLNPDHAYNVHICCYHVNTDGMYPFIQYFLQKHKKEQGDMMTFPTFAYTSTEAMIQKSLGVLELLCCSFYKESCYEYSGYKCIKDNIYLFFDCSELHLDTVKWSRNHDLWLVLIDEIVNIRNVCQFPIAQSVTDFFFKNREFIYLTDDNGGVYETPSVVYSGCKKHKIDFCSVFGVSTSSDPMELLGKSYYFSDYKKAFHTENYDAILRVAVFLGNTKVVMNNMEDDFDHSITTECLLERYSIHSPEYNYLKLTMRMSDRDGLWKRDYDSVIIGKIELDDGSIFQNYPTLVVKDYAQQYVLSSHVIHRKDNSIY